MNKFELSYQNNINKYKFIKIIFLLLLYFKLN